MEMTSADFDSSSAGHGCVSGQRTARAYIALFFEAVRKSTDLAYGLTRIFQESEGVLLSGRDANSS